MSHTSPVLARFPNVLIPFRHVNLSVPQKITVVTLTVGVALLGFLARYLRRRRRTTNPSVKKLGMDSSSGALVLLLLEFQESVKCLVLEFQEHALFPCTLKLNFGSRIPPRLTQ
uniref:Uncharacterized protein n=2 Tax=Timema TaxID=61471 RepID=A0A7R9IQ76_9NEOP|nr:unnamed protein product [Timema tahoe]